MRYFWILAGVLICFTGAAQDLHFTQYYASPLTLNPAQTGNFDNSYRVGLNYRNQWSTSLIPFNTVGMYFEANFLRNKTWDGDWMSGGFQILGDRAGDGKLTTTKFSLSYAYHKSLNRDKSLFASLGASVLYVHKWIDFNKLKFDNQWNQYGFETSLDPGENYENASLGYVDVQAGLSVLYFKDDKFYVIVGGSMIHLNTPNETFLGTSNQLAMRPVVHLYSGIQLKDKLYIYPGAQFMTQRRSRETIAGFNMSQDLKTQPGTPVTRVYWGLWMRNRDSFIALLGGEARNIRVLVSYDMNLSKLVPASAHFGAIELSVVYTSASLKKGKNGKNSVIDCPRF